MQERLQKFLAAAGVASRRKAEELIVQGRVRVNEARVTALGTKIDPEKDLVTVDGQLVSAKQTRAHYLLYKPPGCVTTASDPEGRPTAFEYLRGVKERVFPVGRLDWDAEGALLFTDDGELANRLAHPRYGHRRTYLVKVKGDPPAEALARMTAGVRLEDGPARAFEATVHEHAEKNVWIRVVVGEGRFHLVKRLCEAVGLQVQRLFRPEFGGITVDGLRPGGFRPLSSAEIRALRRAVGLDGGEGEGARPVPRSALPKAARRHGHGPPAPPPPPGAARAPVGEPHGGGETRAPPRSAGEARPEGARGEGRSSRAGGGGRFPRSAGEGRSSRAGGEGRSSRAGGGGRPPRSGGGAPPRQHGRAASRGRGRPHGRRR
jgi:23S rRNA pseudouridine2605 synthase